MSGTTNPFIQQGNLNRLLTAVTFASFPSLNISAYNMGKSFAKLSFEGPFVTQTGTGTGIVNSPEPYVMSTISVGVLRTQTLGSAWITQVQSNALLGSVYAIPDTTTYPTTELYSCSVTEIDPAAFDGIDPVVRLTIRGIFYPNNALWAG